MPRRPVIRPRPQEPPPDLAPERHPLEGIVEAFFHRARHSRPQSAPTVLAQAARFLATAMGDYARSMDCYRQTLPHLRDPREIRPIRANLAALERLKPGDACPPLAELRMYHFIAERQLPSFEDPRRPTSTGP